MYFSMKKQKRRRRDQADARSLVPGARVMTTSGLHGTVTAVADDTIELEIAPGLRTTWVRAAVREVVVPGPVETDEYAEIDGRHRSDRRRRREESGPDRRQRDGPQVQGPELSSFDCPGPPRAGASSCGA